jgi:hypothetical protein
VDEDNAQLDLAVDTFMGKRLLFGKYSSDLRYRPLNPILPSLKTYFTLLLIPSWANACSLASVKGDLIE